VTLEMSQAYGLALQGLGMQTIDANLMPVSVVREGLWRTKTKWFAMAAALGLVSSASMFIRWAIDSNEVDNARQPQVIATALGRAGQLKSEATEAGVSGGAEADPVAMQVLNLPESRHVYAYLVKDLGQMLGSADERAADGRAYEFKSWQTVFVPGGAGGGESEGEEQPSGGRRFGAQPRRQADPFPNHPKIEIVLDIATNEPQPDDFLLETVRTWLLDNASRDDVPYVIVADQELDYTNVGAEDTGRGGGGPGRPFPRPTPRPGAGGRDFPAGGGGGHGGGGGGDLAGDVVFEQPEVVTGGNRGPTRSGQNTSASLETLAPIPEVASAEEGEVVRFQVRYRVALVPVGERTAGGEGAQDGEGGEG
jgi:hypothetical protein